MNENRCCSCGEVIPEGGQVCRNCMEKAEDSGVCYGYVVKDKLMYIISGTIEKIIREFQKPEASEMRIWKGKE